MEIGYASIGNQEVDVFRGRELIYPYVTDYVQRQIIKDGGTVEPIFDTEYKALPELVRREAEAVLVPGAYKTGRIYGLSPITGQFIPFNFTRNGAAAYFDKNGIMQTAPANVPRIDYDPVTKVCRGYLQEAAATNLLPWSNDFTKWIGDPTKQLSDVVTASGKPMFIITKSKSTASEGMPTSMVLTSVAGATYCFRITLRARSVNSVSMGIGAAVDVAGESGWGTALKTGARVVSGPGTVSSGGLVSVLNLSATEDTIVEVWRKYDNAGIGVNTYVYPQAGGSTSLGASVLVACAQLEAAPQCSSYIETTGSQVTRPADTLQSVNDIVPATEGTVNFNGYIAKGNGAVSALYLRKNDNQYFLYSTSSASTLVMSDRTTAVSSQLPVDNSNVKSVSSFGATTGLQKITANGSPIKSGAFKGSIETAPLVFGSSNVSKMYIKSLAVFNRQLTDAEHIMLTQ